VYGFLAGTTDDNCHWVPAMPAAILDHLLEVAPFGRFAINMGVMMSPAFTPAMCRSAD
jgi:hypothetical protein